MIRRLQRRIRTGLDVKLRPGLATDVPVLDALAIQAKAHWGYSAEQLVAWRRDLMVDADLLGHQPVCVAEAQGQIIAFAQVATHTQPWELLGLWVRPDRIGHGLGKVLLEWARDLAASTGQTELAIDSDPSAESFYKARGATRVGTLPAPIEGHPTRVRPQLRLSTGSV